MLDRIGATFADGLGRVVGYLPNLLAALVIVVIGYLLSRVAGTVVSKLLSRTGFDGFATRHLNPRATTPRKTPSTTLGLAVFWLGILVTASMASSSLGLVTLSAGINRVLRFVPNLLVAAVILAVAVGLGRLVAGLLPSGVSRAAQVAVVAIGSFMALDQLGVARNIVLVTFVAVLGTAAVAAAISFGIGNIPHARELTREWAEDHAARHRPASRTEPLTGEAEGFPEEPIDTRH